jgi:hypothetical protein
LIDVKARKNRNIKEDLAVLTKLKDTIQQRLSKIKKMEDNMFPGESDDESEDSEANDSENEGENSEEEEDDKSRAGYLSASINSSDLESVDSESDSESFKDII